VGARPQLRCPRVVGSHLGHTGKGSGFVPGADLALRVLDEELAAASAAAVPEEDRTAGIASTPRR
jgi:hypothetical protein